MTTTGSGTPEDDLITTNQLVDYSYITDDPFTLDPHGVLLRCASGVGPTSGQVNLDIGDWSFNGNSVSRGDTCASVFQQRSSNNNNYPGVINLYPCTFTTNEEGVYSCTVQTSSSTQQTTRVGLYLSGRSESLDMFPITSLLTIFHLST